VRACEQSIIDEHASQALDCLKLAWTALRMAGPFAHALPLAERVRAMPALQGAQAAWVDHVTGTIWMARGDRERARALAERALGPAQEAADLPALTAIQCLMGDVELGAGNFAAAEGWLLKARAASDQSGSSDWRSQVLNSLGVVYQYQGQHARSRTHFSEALTLAFTNGDMRWQAALLGNLASVYYTEGKLESARQSYEQVLSLSRQMGDRRLEGNARCNLGLVHHEQGKHAAATAELNQALALARKLGYARLTHVVLCNLGLVAESGGDMAVAAGHFAAARDAAGKSMEPRSEAHYCAYLAQAQSRLGALAEASLNIERGLTLLGDRPDPTGRGLLHCSQAELLHQQGQAEESAVALGHARGILEEQKWKDDSELGRRVRLSERRIQRAGR
jgi:tetratricopeptide (TPR) repeat protein